MLLCLVFATSQVQGYHAMVWPTIGKNGASPIYALAGCVDFDDNNEKNCGTEDFFRGSLGSVVFS